MARLNLTKGDDYGPNDSDMFTSGIHIAPHWNAIECYGQTLDSAQTIRDQILKDAETAFTKAELSTLHDVLFDTLRGRALRPEHALTLKDLLFKIHSLYIKTED